MSVNVYWLRLETFNLQCANHSAKYIYTLLSKQMKHYSKYVGQLINHSHINP